MRKRLGVLLLTVLAAGLLAGCITVGHEFPYGDVARIQPGVTTQEEIHTLFGNPTRVGVNEGQLEWTYVHYRANIFGRFEGRDLVVRFDKNNRVASYAYNTTDTREKVMPRK